MYVVTRGPDQSGVPKHGYTPKIVSALPSDVPTIEEGDWKYSAILFGWIGHELSGERNAALYQARLAKP